MIVVHACDEVPAPAVGVEADDVVREHALVNGAPHVLGQHVPVVGLRPRDVDELREARVRPVLAHVPRREVEVVVVDEHLGVGVALELLEHDVGEGAVDALVAVRPGRPEPGLDVRRVGEAPEVVLDEPEGAVRDLVVVAVVGELVVGDEPEPVLDAVPFLLDRLVAALACDEAVLVAHRARDPGHVVVGDQPAQRRHEPAAAATHHALAVLAAEEERAAVRDDDQLPALAHRRES